jgi:hypothetical protein
MEFERLVTPLGDPSTQRTPQFLSFTILIGHLFLVTARALQRATDFDGFGSLVAHGTAFHVHAVEQRAFVAGPFH